MAQLTKSDDVREGYCRNYVSQDITQILLDLVSKIQKKISSSIEIRESGASCLFPRLPGSHLTLTNPALELVKTVCQALSLDSVIEMEAGKLKRDALRLLNLGEFAQAATWKDPCLSLVLSEMICSKCNHCRDLDLCRDESCFISQSDMRSEIWRCSNPKCNAAYDMSEIEMKLVEWVNRLAMSFTLQDLKCLRCSEVKLSHMNLHCDCAGKYVHLYPTEDLAQKLNTLLKISKYCNQMIHLQESIEWIFGMNSWLRIN